MKYIDVRIKLSVNIVMYTELCDIRSVQISNETIFRSLRHSRLDCVTPAIG
jgi:hypothetical protein